VLFLSEHSQLVQSACHPTEVTKCPLDRKALLV
jgi:hypothetical protein